MNDFSSCPIGHLSMRVLKLVVKSLDLNSSLPIIDLCASERTRTELSKENPDLEEAYRIVHKSRFILDKKFSLIYTNCSKVLHQMTAP